MAPKRLSVSDLLTGYDDEIQTLNYVAKSFAFIGLTRPLPPERAVRRKAPRNSGTRPLVTLRSTWNL
jgi:hypothetical protein